MTSLESLTIKANHIFLYYEDLPAAQQFYEEVLGLERILDYGFATIHRISATTYVGLVDEARGMHKAIEPKTVTLSFITEEVDVWYQYLIANGVGIHHPLANATRHPTRGFVAYDPEGYFLEFETFLEHAQNDKLRQQLQKTEATYPLTGRKKTRPNELGVQGNIVWLYYQDLAIAQQFYEEVMGLTLLTDQGFAKVYGSSATGFVGLVDAAHGLHPFSDEKGVTVCFFTDDVKGWLTQFKQSAIKLHTPAIKIESDAVELFVAYDVGGYFLEFDRFLMHALNQDILHALGS